MQCDAIQYFTTQRNATKHAVCFDLFCFALFCFVCKRTTKAADIANTFCEYCEMSNLCADYDKEYPTPAQQDVFFWNYLLHSDPIRAKKFSSYSRRTMQQMKTETQNPGVSSNRNDDDDDKEWNLFSTTLQQEVGRFSLLSHLGWAVWSILKRQEQDGVDFDYMAYARHRMDGYAWAKKRFIVVAAGEATATAAS
uniref:Uncharacterized protein n=1 Tax=Pseudo-nitzschia australis TaxID=44445 RepID=A0A7S4AFJ1_9STRA